MGRAIKMENELERVIGKTFLLENRIELIEDCLDEILDRLEPLIKEEKNEKKAKKSNKK